MKKKYILIIALFVVFLFVIGFFIFYQNNSVRTFDKKISLIEDFYSNNEELQTLKNNQNENLVILSICDNKGPAIVKSNKASTLEKATKNVQNELKKYIRKNNYNPELVKLDFAKDLEVISLKDLETEFSFVEADYGFRHGILLSYQNRDDIVLTEAELNANQIIDYDNCKLNLKNLNKYLSYYNINSITSLPENVTIFTNVSFFCDSNNNVYELENDIKNFGRRKQNPIQKDSINEILDSSTTYLSNMLKDDGKFVYAYYPLEDTESDNYNVLRHAGSVWSLIVMYNNQDALKEKIDSSINYLVNTIKYSDAETAYVYEEESNEIKLGGNALTTIALCEYTEKFSDMKYLELLQKLGNGIISMQKETGQYIHVLNPEDFSLKEEFRTVYYDGEATFALCKLYGITKDEKYLKSAQNAIDYFIKNDYTQYCDHWISYALNEITKYVDNKEYYQFGLENINNNLFSIYDTNVVSNTNFEMLIQGFELYNRILEKQIDVPYLNNFSTEFFINTIKQKAQLQLNSYLYPEVAMYLKSPSKYCNAFYVRESNFRIRIDDIQHSILGYHFYINNFDKIEKAY